MSSVTQTTTVRRPEREGCPECAGRVRAEGIEAVCEDCGAVVREDALDHRIEYYGRGDSGGDPRHYGNTTPTMHNRGLGSIIGNGPGLNHRQRRWHRRVTLDHDNKQRGKAFGMGEIQRLTAAVGSGQATHCTASQLYRTAADAGLLVGRSYEGFAAACVIAAARIHGEPVGFADVASHSRVDRDSPKGGGRLRRCYTVLVRELDVPVPPLPPRALVPGLCSALGLDAGVRREAVALLDALDGTDVAGKKPQGLAAAAVYLAAPCPRTEGGPTQAEIVAETDCTAVTLRNGMEVLDG